MKDSRRYILITIAVIALWNSQIIYPLKLFTVFLHELGHAFMSVLFGQGFQGISISYNEGGATYVLPDGLWSSIMIANGGYLGSLFFGILVLLLSRTWFRKNLLGTIAMILLYISYKYAVTSFTMIYSFAFAAAIFVLYMINSDRLIFMVIEVIGITSITYTIYDIFADTILLSIFMPHPRQKVLTDAMQLQNITGIPALLWGLFWFAVSLASVKGVIYTDNKKMNPRQRKSQTH